MVLQNSEIGWREVCNFGLNLKKKEEASSYGKDLYLNLKVIL